MCVCIGGGGDGGGGGGGGTGHVVVYPYWFLSVGYLMNSVYVINISCYRVWSFETT